MTVDKSFDRALDTIHAARTVMTVRLFRHVYSLPGQAHDGGADLRVALRLDFVALLDAYTLIDNFLLQAALNPVAVGGPFAHRRLDAVLQGEYLKLVKYLRSDVKRIVDLVLVRVLGGKRCQNAAGV